MQGEIRITVIATGFDKVAAHPVQSVPGIQPVAIPRPTMPTQSTMAQPALPTNGGRPEAAPSPAPAPASGEGTDGPDIPTFLRNTIKKSF
jgi:hypothetical protein